MNAAIQTQQGTVTDSTLLSLPPRQRSAGVSRYQREHWEYLGDLDCPIF
ncbi:MAG: hypothetical protein KDN20_04185 [Verrucomicrobiae bacterium]|nr:hypothetical protein [Verrucomicrobiae bacterium]